MWEMTKETGHGLSFGGESGSSFQSGKTLFRKVKSVQYGPDGKAYEYTLDLGAIPKVVKEATKQHGWNFKTVLRRDKASWPAGYAPWAINNEETVRQSSGAFQQEQPQGSSFCINCGVELEPEALFCPSCGTRYYLQPEYSVFAKTFLIPDTVVIMEAFNADEHGRVTTGAALCICAGVKDIASFIFCPEGIELSSISGMQLMQMVENFLNCPDIAETKK